MLIKEFLPNPIGQDADGEYIKLFNDGNLPVNLAGWSVKDASGKTFNLTDSLDGGRELLLPYLQTKVSLNNNGEQIFLYDNAGKLADELSYSGQAEEGQIIVKKQLVTSELANSENEKLNSMNQINYSKIIFIDVSAAIVLSLLGLYLILQLEKKLDIKLW